MSDLLKKEIQEYYECWFNTNAVYEKWAKKNGITYNMLFTFYVIYNFPEECNQNFICQKLQLPKQTVNGILDTLEKRGDILKIVSPKDKRNKMIGLTPKGKIYARELLEKLYRLEESALKKIDSDMREKMNIGNQQYFKYLQEEIEKN